ncbi:MAG TPA: DUF2254 domain-containing protein [Myxococcota bacterium]|nr:DUF2254 domain-containing protein [Myxococcota bacterium]
MISTLRHRWYEMRSSFWFVPACIVVGSVAIALAVIQVDAALRLHEQERQSWLLGAGADGARGLLTAVASSMITVAGVVFSITIVALSLTSSQYTSRVLLNFMRDRTNQSVLGVFVGIFAYCLVVLRTIRGGDEGAFVPPLAVMGGLLLAFVGIALLIYFIHHISVSIQASSILATAAQETIAAVDQLFPESLGDDADEAASAPATSTPAAHVWSAVAAAKTGYLETVHEEALLAWAREHETVLRMERGIGEFVVEGTSLVSVARPVDDAAAAELNALYVISRQRTLHQDASFGIRQIVDVALKALSPGVNDTTTAVMCVDYLSAILVRLAGRSLPTPHRLDEGELRVIARGPSFETLLADAFDQIRQNAGGNVAVLTRQLRALELIASGTSSARRRRVLRTHADLIAAEAQRTISSPHDSAGVASCMLRLSRALEVRGRRLASR